MKWAHIIPLATLSAAFVVPNEQILAELQTQDERLRHGQSWIDAAVDFTTDAASRAHSWGQDAAASASQAFDEAMERGEQAGEGLRDAAAHAKAWAEAALNDFDLFDEEDDPPHGPPHGPPRRPPHHGPPPPKRPPHRRPGHGRPHHPPHDDAPNKTVYELISESKYTTKLAQLINKYDDLVDALNSTKANVTVFAPIDSAFDKIPEDHPEPSKEQLKALLSYHVVPDVYPAKRVLLSHTAPTLLKSEHLSSQPEPQRIAFKLGLRGLSVNFYSRIVAVNVFATNGVVHGISSLLVPPPNAITLIDLLPSEFSTLELGLSKTGLLDTLNTTDHAGGTLFAPSNFAFTKLGPKINAFLFSKYGTKYLKALLEYHVVPDITLYSDAYYKAGGEKDDSLQARDELPGGKFHINLPTLLEDHSLSVDLVRWKGFVTIHINGFSRVTVSDGIAEDGVIHGVSDVLIPPKKLSGGFQEWQGDDLTVDDLIERLEPYVNKSDL